MIHDLAVPFAGFEDVQATDVRPDFAVVARKIKSERPGSWLVVGDSKDYERMRSRVEDTRLLKGFLQVAVGAESCSSWSRRPADMTVHRYGVLAVPRNAFLQPEALVEQLDDHRAEVRLRVAERRAEAANAMYDPALGLEPFAASLVPTFDPGSCPSCTLFAYCRDELRRSSCATDVLVEVGVPKDMRPHVAGLVDGTGTVGRAPASVVASVKATIQGVAHATGQRRVDQAGQPGTVNVVLAKSDAAALGVHGMAVQRVTAEGREPWQVRVFEAPQSEATRRAVMRMVGQALSSAMAEMRRATAGAPSPIHLVVPDKPTADILVSIADNLAGIELSRLRWKRDEQMGRKPLTFNGEEAEMPKALSERDRTAVSFLLEEDRARALTLRSPIIDVRSALAGHLVAGGPATSAYRLDYLVAWAAIDPASPADHRSLADTIETREHTPGARLTNRRSDAIHQALTGPRGPSRRAGPGPADPTSYAALVSEELEYKCATLEAALDALDAFPGSTLREVHRAIEGDAQLVWRRRLSLHASDLVRFGRTYRHWRNSLVPTIESDARCHDQLLALASPQTASDMATDAGTREVVFATVMAATPLDLEVESRRVGDRTRLVLLHVNGAPCVEAPHVQVTAQAGSFRFAGLALGPLSAARPGHDRRVRAEWAPAASAPALAPGDRLVLADVTWFTKNTNNRYLNVDRPKPDEVSAPTRDCDASSYVGDPVGHQYCCRPHEDGEADWSDELARRRTAGELNPEVWPPVRDGDAFETPPAGAPVGDPTAAPATRVPDGLTLDDLD